MKNEEAKCIIKERCPDVLIAWPTAFLRQQEDVWRVGEKTVLNLFTMRPDRCRYSMDELMNKGEHRWYQLDSKQDAWYYGQWLCPTTQSIVSYAEGDIYIELHDDDWRLDLLRRMAVSQTVDWGCTLDPGEDDSFWKVERWERPNNSLMFRVLFGLVELGDVRTMKLINEVDTPQAAMEIAAREFKERWLSRRWGGLAAEDPVDSSSSMKTLAEREK